MKNLNPDALEDLYNACLSAVGAYRALELYGASKEFPGHNFCLRDLKAAIAKAERIKPEQQCAFCTNGLKGHDSDGFPIICDWCNGTGVPTYLNYR